MRRLTDCARAVYTGYAAQATDTSVPELVAALTSTGQAVSAMVLCGRDSDGDTCLHVAARAGSAPAITALLELLGDEATTALRIRNNAEATPRDVASTPDAKAALRGERTSLADNVR